MTIFENGNMMCRCGVEMQQRQDFFPCNDNYVCPSCDSWVDNRGLIHYSESFKQTFDGEVSVVIPTIKDEVITRESIPQNWSCIIESDGNVSEARNEGAKKATSEFIVFADDDIHFDYEELEYIIANLKQREIAGIKGHSLGMLKSRLLIMRKSDFEEVGGFDENMTWMEDTDICLRFLKKGYDLKQLPHDFAKHEPHEKRDRSWGGKWHLYLLRKHGIFYLRKFVPAIFRKIWGVLR